MFNTDDDIYFAWLVSMLVPPRNKGIVSHNHLLLYTLYTRRFLVHPSVPMDKNRLYDGLELRQKFIQETGKYRYKWKNDDEPSILEVLVALAIRCEEVVGEHLYRWFWEMMDNLGVMNTPDKEFIDHMLDVFINREYNYDGTDGGLFIISSPRKPLNETDLWYQAMWYLNRSV